MDIQERNVLDLKAIDNYVTMDIARMIVTVDISAYNRLMSCEMFAAKLLAESLCAVNRQFIFNAVSLLKTNKVLSKKICRKLKFLRLSQSTRSL